MVRFLEFRFGLVSNRKTEPNQMVRFGTKPFRDVASVKKWNRVWFVRERNNLIFFINKKSKDTTVTYSLWHCHEESMKSRKYQRNLLNMSWWFYFTMKELYDDL
jgi:hypothetical protein